MEAQIAFQEGEEAPSELEKFDFKPSLKQGPGPWLLGCTALEYGTIGPPVFPDAKGVPSTPRSSLHQDNQGLFWELVRDHI